MNRAKFLLLSAMSLNWVVNAGLEFVNVIVKNKTNGKIRANLAHVMPACDKYQEIESRSQFSFQLLPQEPCCKTIIKLGVYPLMDGPVKQWYTYDLSKKGCTNMTFSISKSFDGKALVITEG